MTAVRVHVALAVGFWLLNAALHARAFVAPHEEGDEVVYLALAQEMNWDLTHYTTRDHPVVSEFPFSTYRKPLFYHPPLYPLLLKAGYALGSPVALGIAFSIASMGLLLGFTVRFMLRTRAPPRLAVLAYAGIATCPLLLFSTARLHLDGLLGIYVVCAFLASVEAFERRGWGWTLAAGALWVVALNLRYNAPFALPLIGLAQLHALHLRGQATGKGWAEAKAVAAWIPFAVVVLLVLTLGLQHFYRAYAVLGTLMPDIVLDTSSPHLGQLQFFRRQRGRGEVLLGLFLIYPAVLLFATPVAWRYLRADLLRGRLEPILALSFWALMAVQTALLFNQLRYFAPWIPLLLLCGPYLIARCSADGSRLPLKLAAVTLIGMVGSSVHNTVLNPEHPGIVPYYSAVLHGSDDD